MLALFLAITSSLQVQLDNTEYNGTDLMDIFSTNSINTNEIQKIEVISENFNLSMINKSILSSLRILIIQKSVSSLQVPTNFLSGTGIENVSIPGVKIIGWEAFAQCYNLTEVHFPDVTDILIRSFYYCQSIVTFDAPNLKSVNYSSFGNCFNLTNINLENIETIGSSGFSGCKSFVDISLPNCVTIKNYAFYQCSNLKSLVGNKLVNLDENAFQNGNIESFTAPNVRSIPDNCFYQCRNLKEINIAKVEKIGAFAFTDSLIESLYLQCFKTQIN